MTCPFLPLARSVAAPKLDLPPLAPSLEVLCPSPALGPLTLSDLDHFVTRSPTSLSLTLHITATLTLLGLFNLNIAASCRLAQESPSPH